MKVSRTGKLAGTEKIDHLRIALAQPHDLHIGVGKHVGGDVAAFHDDAAALAEVALKF